MALYSNPLTLARCTGPLSVSIFRGAEQRLSHSTSQDNLKRREIIREQELCTLGSKVSYKSHSGIIRAESRYFCSWGCGGGAHSRLSRNILSRAGCNAKARGQARPWFISTAFGDSTGMRRRGRTKACFSRNFTCIMAMPCCRFRRTVRRSSF